MTGNDTGAFAKQFACIIGSRVLPLALCEDRLYEDDLVARLLASEP